MLLASLMVFSLGIMKAVKILGGFLSNFAEESVDLIPFIELMDIFLIATVLLIFALGIYELFIGKLSLPEWLIIRNLHDLKVKLSSLVIMVMGIIFLKHLVEWQDPQYILFRLGYGCSICGFNSV
ncbi:hypothetical protein C1G87_1490 [Dehalococcoides mccartyi]|uniref:Uncharacterized protein n=1 Tax=Dehalococcoides mccartyi TaxID=61435 RepID=A0A328ENC3_9CHLR|nr:hypothetical protein C1G87_1490 [Dehalococcoides mccartyi]